MNDWIKFNIHNKVGMRVATDAPTASLFLDMFDPFVTQELDHYDLTITGNIAPMGAVAHGEVHGATDFQYTDTELYLEAMKVQILFKEDGIYLNGRSELLVFAVPLIDHLMVQKNVAMIHAATVDYRGLGVCMPAWGGTGKTSTISKLVKIDGVGFMGDDWAFVSDSGRLLGYQKPLFIKPYHRSLYPHLFKKKRKPLVPKRLSKPISRMTTLVHPYITKYPRIARFTRRWSPEHMMVMPRDAFLDAKFSTDVSLSIAMFVERFDGPEPVFVEKSKSWMVSRMIGNFYSELPRQSRVVLAALGASGIAAIDQALCEKAAVIEKALGNIPTFLLQVPTDYTPDRASNVIIDYIDQVLEHMKVVR